MPGEIRRFLARRRRHPRTFAPGGITGETVTRATTAVQALALGNDPLVLHQAARIAARLRATATDARPATDDERIDALFRHLLLRMPSAEERALLAGYAARHGLAAAAHLLLTTNEFLYLD
jgi:hypothetical protein